MLYPDEIVNDVSAEPFQADEQPEGNDAETDDYSEAPDEDLYLESDPINTDNLMDALQYFDNEFLEDIDANQSKSYHVAGPWTAGHHFYMDVITGECFLQEAVKSDAVSRQDMIDYKDLIDAADRAELQSFIDEKIFKKIWAQTATTRAIDAVWVRRWKRGADDTWIVKSRLCSEGFLDP